MPKSHKPALNFKNVLGRLAFFVRLSRALYVCSLPKNQSFAASRIPYEGSLSENLKTDLAWIIFDQSSSLPKKTRRLRRAGSARSLRARPPAHGKRAPIYSSAHFAKMALGKAEGGHTEPGAAEPHTAGVKNRRNLNRLKPQKKLLHGGKTRQKRQRRPEPGGNPKKSRGQDGAGSAGMICQGRRESRQGRV